MAEQQPHWPDEMEVWFFSAPAADFLATQRRLRTHPGLRAEQVEEIAAGLRRLGEESADGH